MLSLSAHQKIESRPVRVLPASGGGSVGGGGGGDSSMKCPDVCVGDLKMYPL